MIFNVTYKTSVEDIQRMINEVYPFLKLELCKNITFQGERVTRRTWHRSDAKLLEIAGQCQPTWIVLYPWYTVKYVIEIFKTKLALHAQIFRKENEQWISIIPDDGLTLQEENEIGRKSFIPNSVIAIDDKRTFLNFDNNHSFY